MPHPVRRSRTGTTMPVPTGGGRSRSVAAQRRDTSLPVALLAIVCRTRSEVLALTAELQTQRELGQLGERDRARRGWPDASGQLAELCHARCGTAPRGALACGPRPTGRPSFTPAGAEPNRSTCARRPRLQRGLLGRLSRDLALPRLERFFARDLTNIANDVSITANDLNLQGRTHRRPGLLVVPSRLRLPL
jgi:hypothetical protein